MTGERRDASVNWELIQLPALFIRMSPDGETVTRETLRAAIAYQEFLTVYAADMVIQSAIEDGIIERENGTVLRLSDSAYNQLGDFYPVDSHRL